MTYMLFLILILCLLQIISVIFLNFQYRHYLNNMHGMLIAMTLGMMSGLLFGTVAGVILHGDLYTSTTISILIGVSIGFITGVPFSLVAVIDGSVSGLMGGMMGAMLGEMITMSNPDATIKVLALFTVMILMLVSYVTEEKIREINKNAFFLISKYPFLSLFITIIFFFLIKNVEIITMNSPTHH